MSQRDEFGAFLDFVFERRAMKQARHYERQKRLMQAVNHGFTVGKVVLLSNGVKGQIVKINTTRVKVKGNDGRMWSVPPAHMKLVTA